LIIFYSCLLTIR